MSGDMRLRITSDHTELPQWVRDRIPNPKLPYWANDSDYLEDIKQRAQKHVLAELPGASVRIVDGIDVFLRPGESAELSADVVILEITWNTYGYGHKDGLAYLRTIPDEKAAQELEAQAIASIREFWQRLKSQVESKSEVAF